MRRRTRFVHYGLKAFPHCAPTATPEEVAAIYGYAITAKSRGGLSQLRGLRTKWNRFRRFLDAAQDNGEVTVGFACQFIDFTRLTNMAKTFEWAATALGMDVFWDLAKEPSIALRQPRRGWAAEAPSHVPRKAPWISDGFIKFLAHRAVEALSKYERVRAFFFYCLAIGGVRFQDAQHVLSLELTLAEVKFVASRFKATAGDNVETFAVPVRGPDQIDFTAVAREMKAQMGDGFLLAHPENANEVHSQNFSPVRGCNYQAGISLIRTFAERFQAKCQRLSPRSDDATRDYSKITMHSVRSWLATLCRQVRVPPHEVNEILHWSNKTMQKCYDQNFLAVEVSQRARLVRILNSDWSSAGPGTSLDDNVPVWDDTTRNTARF